MSNPDGAKTNIGSNPLSPNANSLNENKDNVMKNLLADSDDESYSESSSEKNNNPVKSPPVTSPKPKVVSPKNDVQQQTRKNENVERPLEKMGLDENKFITEPTQTSNYGSNRESGNDSKTISILNYDQSKRLPFTEPETLQAMAETGISAEDLFMPSQAQINSYPKDPDIRKVVIEHHKDRVQRMVSIVKDQREKIIQRKKDDQESQSQNEADAAKARGLDQSEERARRRAKKDAESLIYSYMRQELIIEEQARRDELERERQRQKIADQHKREAEARKKTERANRERREMEEKRQREDDEKRRELFRKDQEARATAQRRIEERKKQAMEAERNRRERAEATKRKLEQLDADRNGRLRERAAAMEEREAAREERLAKERAEASRKARKEAASKLERTINNRRSIEESNKESLDQLMQRERERLDRIEQERREREMRASAVYTQRGVTSDRYEKWKAEEAQKQRELDNAIRERDARAAKTAEEREKARLMKSVQMRLKDEERERAARRQTAIRNQHIEQTRARLSQTDHRVEEFRRERDRMFMKKRLSSERLMGEIAVLNEDIETAKYSGKKLNVDSIASRYDIDVSEIRNRVRSRQSSLSSSLPPIRPQTTQAVRSQNNDTVSNYENPPK